MARRLRRIFSESICCYQNIGVHQEPKDTSWEAFISGWVYRFFKIIRDKLWWQICVHGLTVYLMIPAVIRFCPFRASNGLNDITQGAASLCPGLWAGCPFRASFTWEGPGYGARGLRDRYLWFVRMAYFIRYKRKARIIPSQTWYRYGRRSMRERKSTMW